MIVVSTRHTDSQMLLYSGRSFDCVWFSTRSAENQTQKKVIFVAGKHMIVAGAAGLPCRPVRLFRGSANCPSGSTAAAQALARSHGQSGKPPNHRRRMFSQPRTALEPSAHPAP